MNTKLLNAMNFKICDSIEIINILNEFLSSEPRESNSFIKLIATQMPTEMRFRFSLFAFAFSRSPVERTKNTKHLSKKSQLYYNFPKHEINARFKGDGETKSEF